MVHLRLGDRAIRSCRLFKFPRKFAHLTPLLLALGWMSSGGVVRAFGNVMISEFMAVNNTTLKDEDATYSDWIEVYNSGTNNVDLAGWYLSNKSTNLTQRHFPSTN